MMLGDETDATILWRISVRDSPRPHRGHWLEQAKDGQVQDSRELTHKRLVLGRGDEADWKLVSAQASRQHAEIVLEGDEYRVTDMESRNGLFLNEVRIHSALLRDGDVIQIGDVMLRYRES